MKKLILVASIVSLSTWASETLQLKDGRYIQLNDDFTWQYVPQETQPQQTSELAPLVLAAAYDRSTDIEWCDNHCG